MFTCELSLYSYYLFVCLLFVFLYLYSHRRVPGVSDENITWLFTKMTMPSDSQPLKDTGIGTLVENKRGRSKVQQIWYLM